MLEIWLIGAFPHDLLTAAGRGLTREPPTATSTNVFISAT